MVARTLALVLLVAAAAPVLIEAQSSAAPDLDVENNTLWAHNTEANTDFFMNTLMDDGSGSNPGTTGLAGTNTWTIVMKPGQGKDIHLDPAGTVDMTVYVGGSNHAGSVDVTSRLKAHGAILAHGDVQSQVITPAAAGDGTYAMLTWSITPNSTFIAAGSSFEWEITANGVASGAFIGMSEARGRSHIVLPIIEPPTDGGGGNDFPDLPDDIPATEPQVTTDASDGGARIGVVYNSPDTPHQVNLTWNTPATGFWVNLGTSITMGEATMRIIDGANQTVFEETRTGNTQTNTNVTGAAGDWTLQISTEGAQGSIEFSVGIQQADPAGGDGTDDHEGEGHDDGAADDDAGDADSTVDTTGDDAGDEGEDSPGTGASAFIAALAMAGLAARRRRS
ncbi:MAG: hypothetical protein ACPGQL_01725 [Thermoplasmatota archaeon]